MILLQIFWTQSKGERSVTPNFESVVKNCHTYSPAWMGVRAVADRIDYRFTEGGKRKEWLVLTLQDTRENPSCHWKMPAQEKHRLAKKMESMAIQLPLVEKFGLVDPFEARHTQLALGIVWEKVGTKEHNRCVQYLPVLTDTKTIQNVCDITPSDLGHTARLNPQTHGAEYFFVIEIGQFDPYGGPIFPSVLAVGTLKQ